MNDSSPIFVTGGSGFVGRHIVRLLRDRGFPVRMLARRVPERHDRSVEVVLGDLTQPATYAPALRGAAAVVHGALTDKLTTDVAATAELQKLSAEAGVGRFIHLSSIVVSGIRPEGTVDEESQPVAASDHYSRTKLAIEQALLANSAISDLFILRLGCVYGPGGGWWSHTLLNMMERGKLILVNGGSGIANLIHVSDAAAAVVNVLENRSSPPGIYQVTDGMPAPWKLYFSALEDILGRTATVSMTAEEALEYGRKWLRPSLARRAFRKLTGGEVIYPLDANTISAFASRAVFSNHKLQTVLGFRPVYDLARGMKTVSLDRQSRWRPQRGIGTLAPDAMNKAGALEVDAD